MEEKGPTYGVKLLDSLPIGDGTWTQQMPSRQDLDGIKNVGQGQRVVAGYEVLLDAWRRQTDIAHALADQLVYYKGSTVPDEFSEAARMVDEGEEAWNPRGANQQGKYQ